MAHIQIEITELSPHPISARLELLFAYALELGIILGMQRLLIVLFSSSILDYQVNVCEFIPSLYNMVDGYGSLSFGGLMYGTYTR
jgi:hypothetical protein